MAKTTLTVVDTNPAKFDWPQSTDKRLLSVVLNPSEIESYGRLMANTIPDLAQLESEAKSAADTFKAKIKAIECQQFVFSKIIREGREDRQVDCEWIFECAGIDAGTGERIGHPDKKTLIRCDTGEVVEIRDITTDDRQMALLADDE